MSTSVASVSENLEAECRAAAQLVELLKREQDRLIEADIQNLSSLTHDKAALVEHMSALAMQRHQKLAAAGFTADESGMQDWLKTPAAKEAVRKTWEQLHSFAKSAKELNRVNGLLINKHLSRNQDALSVLNNQRSGGNLYGPNGQAMNRPGSRNLVLG